MAFFEVTDLHKSFGNKEVLKGVSLTLDKGQIMAVIGDSGNGKTTFLRCLNFLTEADTGTISINGETIFDANVPLKPSELRKKRMKMGLVFQSYNLFPQYTVLKNTYLAANLLVKEEASAYAKTLTNASLSEKRRLVSDFKKKRKAENVENAKQLIGSMGLDDESDKYPCQLSGGQSQRAAIARALMLSPEILCFDEPTSALDPKLTAEVLNVIKALKEEGRTMIVVTHEMSFAASCADKIVFFRDGKVVEQGGPEILTDPETADLKDFLQLSKE